MNNPIVANRALIDKKKYTALVSFLRGSSVSANPDYLQPGSKEALAELEREGICFIDKSAIAKNKKEAKHQDPGDSMGRYRLVKGKADLAKALHDRLEFMK